MAACGSDRALVAKRIFAAAIFLVEPLAVSFHAVNRARVTPGDKVAVFGAGPIGLGIVIGLRRQGVKDIAIFDLSPLRRPSPYRRTLRGAPPECS